jgi:hypothetical protein
VLGRIFGSEREEGGGNCIMKNFTVQLIVRAIKTRIGHVMHVASIGRKNDGYKILIRNLKARISLGSHKHKCKNNIKMDLKEIDTSEINTAGS